MTPWISRDAYQNLVKENEALKEGLDAMSRDILILQTKLLTQQDAIAGEREACAMLAEIEGDTVREDYGDGHVSLAGQRIATAIRARTALACQTKLLAQEERERRPIDVVLYCPKCALQERDALHAQVKDLEGLNEQLNRHEHELSAQVARLVEALKAGKIKILLERALAARPERFAMHGDEGMFKSIFLSEMDTLLTDITKEPGR